MKYGQWVEFVVGSFRWSLVDDGDDPHFEGHFPREEKIFAFLHRVKVWLKERTVEVEVNEQRFEVDGDALNLIPWARAISLAHRKASGLGSV